MIEESGDDAQRPGLPGGLISGAGAIAGKHHPCQEHAQTREAGLVAGAPGGKAAEAGDRVVPREAGQVAGVDVQQQYGRVRLCGESGVAVIGIDDDDVAGLAALRSAVCAPSIPPGVTTRISGAGYQL